MGHNAPCCRHKVADRLEVNRPPGSYRHLEGLPTLPPAAGGLEKSLLSASCRRHAERARSARLPVGQPPTEPSGQVVPGHLVDAWQRRPAATPTVDEA